MTVSLILSPEVGIHYPNSGLPKDVISRPDNMAKHCHGGPMVVHLPPNAYQLPSYFAPEFSKRYYSFLSRMDSLLADLGRQPGDVLRGVNVVLTGSFWKYYRSPRASTRSLFSGPAGDYSSNATLHYRQCLEEFYSQREFCDPNPAAANRWKSAALDDVNRRWFYQQSEDVFRARSSQTVRKKGHPAPVREIELYTPEADPGFTYQAFLETVSGESSDFSKLSTMIDELALRGSQAGGGPASPFLHWTSLGSFHRLSDPEKQFLMLKSLLLMAGRGGGILVDDEEWFSLSQSFRTRAEAFARAALHGDFQLKNRALMLTSHLWSTGGVAGVGAAVSASASPRASGGHSAAVLWEELVRRVGPRTRMISSLELATRERDSNLLVVDPTFVFTREVIQKLVSWAKSDRVVVVPRSAFYTESARRELEKIAMESKSIEIDLGLPYRLHSVGEGKLVVYDPPEGMLLASERDLRGAWRTFLTAMLSLAEVQSYCRMSDDRLAVIPVRRKGSELGLFILNPTRRPISADIIFPTNVEVTDLAAALAAGTGAAPPQAPPAAHRFSLDVPPCGILPLGVKGLDFSVEEKGEARGLILNQDSQKQEQDPAIAALPGFDPNHGMDQVWS
ncbi:MAG TPA: DUF4350 domain-containing protein [Bdellovibrionota bacterium]|nr:DUF4350 domain-containing protein [Bdellovibrionota bacterium]